MNVVFQLLQAKKKESERLARQGKVKYEYDSDEDTEGGTWEHKRYVLDFFSLILLTAEMCLKNPVHRSSKAVRQCGM